MNPRRILVVIGHPISHSYNHELARTYASAAEAGGLQCGQALTDGGLGHPEAFGQVSEVGAGVAGDDDEVFELVEAELMVTAQKRVGIGVHHRNQFVQGHHRAVSHGLSQPVDTPVVNRLTHRPLGANACLVVETRPIPFTEKSQVAGCAKVPAVQDSRNPPQRYFPCGCGSRD